MDYRPFLDAMERKENHGTDCPDKPDISRKASRQRLVPRLEATFQRAPRGGAPTQGGRWDQRGRGMSGETGDFKEDGDNGVSKISIEEEDISNISRVFRYFNFRRNTFQRVTP